jgi:Flp pilus assembly protein TadG
MREPFVPTAASRRFARLSFRLLTGDARGTALIEFALISPVMLLLLALCVNAGEALAIAQKVTSTSRTIVDIVSKNSQLSTSQMTAILNAAAYTMSPNVSANLSMVVAEIQTDSSGAATVAWSAAAYGGTALTKGKSFTLPPSMAVPSTYYIYGQVSYTFSPLGLSFLPAHSIVLTDNAYFSPRVSSAVQYPYPN